MLSKRKVNVTLEEHMRNPLRFVLGTILVLGILTNGAAHARDLQGRLGLGYNAQFANVEQSNGAPGISVKYGFTRDIAAEGVVAIATGPQSNSATGVKFFKNLFYETNLNFYFMVGGALVSAQIANTSHSGAEFQSGFGAEFFIPGVESLGFSMETGGRLENLRGSFALKTLGVSFLNGGMHFYF